MVLSAAWVRNAAPPFLRTFFSGPQDVSRYEWAGGEGIQLLIERKMFWATFAVLSLASDLILPLCWAMGATVPILFFSWWVAYRSGWF
jgi:hypothetical protein